VLSVQELEHYIVSSAPPPSPEKTVKGYRVKVQYESGGVSREDIVRRIVGPNRG
jgi:hypothetical protein